MTTAVTAPVQSVPSTAGAFAADRPLRRPRHTAWPYAGLVSAVSAATSLLFLSQGNKQFDLDSAPTTSFVLDNLHGATWIKFGGAMGLVSVVAGLVFLLGLGNFMQRLRPERTTVHAGMRVATAAFVASVSVGVMMRYIVAGGAKGGIDKNLYTHDAVSTLSSLADQLTTASYLPALIAMGLVGWVSLRDRILPRPVGVLALLFTASSLTATVALGLPYSSILDYPVFATVISIAAWFSRKAV
jgi:hypothetical protein